MADLAICVMLTKSGKEFTWNRMSYNNSLDCRDLEALLTELRALGALRRQVALSAAVASLSAKLSALKKPGSVKRRLCWTSAIAHADWLFALALECGYIVIQYEMPD